MSDKIELEVAGLSVLQLTELRSALAGFGPDCLTEKPPPSLKGESHGEAALVAGSRTQSPTARTAYDWV